MQKGKSQILSNMTLKGEYTKNDIEQNKSQILQIWLWKTRETLDDYLGYKP